MSEETPQTNSQVITDVKTALVNVLRNDASLCNYERFTDYGKIERDSYNDKYMWTTIQCDLNHDNTANNSQIIRIVNKMDTKFFTMLFGYNGSPSSIGLDNGVAILYSNMLINMPSTSRDRRQTRVDDCLKSLISRMVNLDCTFKIKGTCLTALDFIGKNPNHTSTEAEFTFNLYEYVKKFIFIGDKCYLLAVMDKYHYIYVSQKTLEIIYKLDTTADKSQFRDAVLKLYGYASSNCLLMLNVPMAQYITNDITNLVINDTLKDNVFAELDKNGSSDFSELFEYKFNNDAVTDDYIKSNIKQIIYTYVDNYVKTYYCLKDFSFVSLIDNIKYKMKGLYASKINEAFRNGLVISRVCQRCGWNIYDNKTYRDVRPSTMNYNNQYIWKDVNIIPDTCVLYDTDARDFGIDKYRKLNEAGIHKLRTEYGICVKRLFICLNEGTMLCIGKHPNVSSSGQVCMGDIKATIVFQDVSDDVIISNLATCEKLLTCIHYASSYTSSGQNVFTNPDYSLDYKNFVNGFDSDKSAREAAKKDENLIKNAVQLEDDFEEESMDSSDNSSTEQQGSGIIESDDFEEI